MSDDEDGEMSQASIARKPILERHVQTVMLGLVSSLLLWSGMTTMKLVETTARQDERITQLINITNDLRDEMRADGARYLTIESANMYRQQLNAKIEEMSEKIKDMGR